MAVETFDCGQRRAGPFVPSTPQAGGRDLSPWFDKLTMGLDKYIKNRVCGLCSIIERPYSLHAIACRLEDAIKLAATALVQTKSKVTHQQSPGESYG